MQSMFIILCSFIFLVCDNFSPCYAETSGEDLYYRGSYLDAESYFREMDNNNPKDVRWRYNRGCAAYKSDQMDASLSAFNSVTKRSKDPELLFRASYNAGNILFKKGDFASAAQFYTQALKIKPDDEDARYNLSLALVKKKAAQQKDKDSKCDNPQNGDQNKDSKSDSQKDDQQNQENKDSQQKDQDKKDKDSKSKEDAKKKDQNSKDKQEDDKSQQSAKNEKQEEKPDMSKELKAAQAMPDDKKEQQEQTSEQKAQQMAVLKAQALLDNIQEDRSIQMQQMKAEGKEDARSGKHW
ncbi:von Willebrand factor type A domain protein [Candidatus Magnetomorum sp. HK-1]|nr:von Willebrand factor type A domain protein [Candidatus Magnetomorum sp. HK-1]